MDSEISRRRLAVLSSHLGDVDETQGFVSFEDVAGTSAENLQFPVAEMRKFLDQDFFEHRDKVQELMVKDPLWALAPGKYFDLPHETMRELTLMRMRRLNELGYLKDLKENLPRYIAFTETLYYGDLSTCVRLNGAHIALFCGALSNLGTERHREKFLQYAADLRLIGCFALTELGHGSNVQGIETTITYDKSRSEFVVNTPTETAQKMWIGGAVGAAAAVVFGQLFVDNENKGVHAIVVPMKNPDGTRVKGVTVADCGHKQGLNGVDNGRIWFDNVRVPRENFLNRFSDVNAEGVFSSELPTAVARFARHIGELVSGRVFLSASANNFSKVGLATAVRYALTRRQFSQGPGPEETFVMDYLMHQRRLFPFIAASYVYGNMANVLKNMWLNKNPETMKDVHVWAAGLKPLVTWNAMACLQACRECCGGMGYASANRIGDLKNEGDVWLTFEGDNFVLLQQMSRFLLKKFQDQSTSDKGFHGALAFMNAKCEEETPNFLCPDWQTRVFAVREAALIKRAAASLQEAVGTAGSLMEAWNACVDITTDLSKAHAERLCLEEFIKSTDNAPAALRPMLTLLRSLFALWRMHDDVSFFRATEVVSKHRRGIHTEVNRLCKAMRPFARDLVDSFGIREEILGAIGRDWVQIYSKANISNLF